MSSLRSSLSGALLIAPFLACTETTDSLGPSARDVSSKVPQMTLGSGSSSTLLGRATFNDPNDQTFKIKRITGDWHLEIGAKPGLDVAVQNILFQPGGHSGWHRHPGPVFIQVVSGTMTFYEADDPTCTPIVRTAGQGFLDKGDHAHIARNETNALAQNVVVYFAPPDSGLRINEPRPGNCPF